jgi:hypothetical protein
MSKQLQSIKVESLQKKKTVLSLFIIEEYSCLILKTMKIKGFFKSVSKYLGGKVKLLAYCLMDNHFHFVIQISDVEKK